MSVWRTSRIELLVPFVSVSFGRLERTFAARESFRFVAEFVVLVELWSETLARYSSFQGTHDRSVCGWLDRQSWCSLSSPVVAVLIANRSDSSESFGTFLVTVCSRLLRSSIALWIIARISAESLCPASVLVIFSVIPNLSQMIIRLVIHMEIV